MTYFSKPDELYHHGILGQKWGIRRFQQKNGRLTAAGKAHKEEQNQKKGLTDQQKKAIKIGAAVIGTALVAYGGYKLATDPRAKELANRILNGNKEKRLSEIDETIIKSAPDIIPKSDFGGSSDVIGQVGKSISDINRTVVSSINKDGWDDGNPPRLKPDYARNCTHTSIAYIMNSVLGKNVTAKGFGGVDETSGLVLGDYGRGKQIFEAVFDGIKKTELSSLENRPDIAIDKIKEGTTGILRLQSGDKGHFVNYEKDNFGNLTIVDCQGDKVFQINKAIASRLNFSITDIFDCSNVTLSEDSSNTLPYLVK